MVAVVFPSKPLFWAAAPEIVTSLAVISAIKLDGKVKLYFPASKPLNVWVEVTKTPFETLIVANVPEFETDTSSLPKIPTKVDPEIVATLVLS